MLKGFLLAGVCAAGLSAIITAAQAETIRIAEHRQARIDALKTVVPDIEKKLGWKSKSSNIRRRKRTT